MNLMLNGVESSRNRGRCGTCDKRWQTDPALALSIADSGEKVQLGEKEEIFNPSAWAWVWPSVDYRVTLWAVVGPRRCRCRRFSIHIASETLHSAAFAGS